MISTCEKLRTCDDPKLIRPLWPWPWVKVITVFQNTTAVKREMTAVLIAQDKMSLLRLLYVTFCDLDASERSFQSVSVLWGHNRRQHSQTRQKSDTILKIFWIQLEFMCIYQKSVQISVTLRLLKVIQNSLFLCVPCKWYFVLYKAL